VVSTGGEVENASFKSHQPGKYWTRSQCDFMSYSVRKDVTVEQAKDKCLKTDGCNAFIFNDAGKRSWTMKCPIPVPEPEGWGNGYTGYSLEGFDCNEEAKRSANLARKVLRGWGSGQQPNWQEIANKPCGTASGQAVQAGPRPDCSITTDDCKALGYQNGVTAFCLALSDEKKCPGNLNKDDGICGDRGCGCCVPSWNQMDGRPCPGVAVQAFARKHVCNTCPATDNGNAALAFSASARSGMYDVADFNDVLSNYEDNIRYVLGNDGRCRTVPTTTAWKCNAVWNKDRTVRDWNMVRVLGINCYAVFSSSDGHWELTNCN